MKNKKNMFYFVCKFRARTKKDILLEFEKNSYSESFVSTCFQRNKKIFKLSWVEIDDMTQLFGSQKVTCIKYTVFFISSLLTDLRFSKLERFLNIGTLVL